MRKHRDRNTREVWMTLGVIVVASTAFSFLWPLVQRWLEQP